MIANEPEYRVAQERMAGFKEALSHVDDRREERHPLLQKALRDSLEGLLQDLRDEMAEYKAFRASGIIAPDLSSIDDLPVVLIRGRTAAGLTEKQLADHVGVSEPQIRDYEATRYRGVSLERAQTVAHALGLTLRFVPSSCPVCEREVEDGDLHRAGEAESTSERPRS